MYLYVYTCMYLFQICASDRQMDGWMDTVCRSRIIYVYIQRDTNHNHNATHGTHAHVSTHAIHATHAHIPCHPNWCCIFLPSHPTALPPYRLAPLPPYHFTALSPYRLPTSTPSLRHSPVQSRPSTQTRPHPPIGQPQPQATPHAMLCTQARARVRACVPDR